MDMKDIHKGVKNGNISIAELSNLDSFIKNEYKRALAGELPDNELKALIMVLLDYYIYSEDGSVIITDSEYDKLMRVWVARGNEPLTEADQLKLEGNVWPDIPQRKPSMVGSIKKIYTDEELHDWITKVTDIPYKYDGSERTFVVAPKFDGLSMYYELRDHQISYASNRGKGGMGQDLSRLIRNVGNYEALLEGPDGFYKCELVMSSKALEDLNKGREKPYANRRSATSGTTNAPKNLENAKYLTAIPLAHLTPDGSDVTYNPVWSIQVTIGGNKNTTTVIKNAIDEVATLCRDPKFPYRTDGVILYPVEVANYLGPGNDILESAIAYKFNTAENNTYVEDVYISIGRMGGATPMLKVAPVDVNETTVTDVSLSTFEKFESMDLHYGDQVTIFSAGDVIPQAKIPKKRDYSHRQGKIKLQMICPECGHPLEKVERSTKKNTQIKEEGKLWRCGNSRCPRVVTGRIANFVSKVGGESISDKTVELLYKSHKIYDVFDLLRIRYDDVINLEGYSHVSATLLEQEIKRIRQKPTTESELLGAMGIPDIGAKTCKLILKQIPLQKLMYMKKSAIEYELLEVDGIGDITSSKFAAFIRDNKDDIYELMNLMNIVPDVNYDFGNVVFTGFRSTEWEKRFNELGVEVSDSVNKKTIALFAADLNSGSGKLKKAKKQNIPVYHQDDIMRAFEFLKHHINSGKARNGENPFYE